MNFSKNIRGRNMNHELEPGQWACHTPTEESFVIARRARRKQDGAVILFDTTGKEYLASDCIADDADRPLDESSLNTLVNMCNVLTTDDLELLETLNQQQKIQLWSKLSDEAKERLKMLRTPKKPAIATPWDNQSSQRIA